MNHCAHILYFEMQHLIAASFYQCVLASFCSSQLLAIACMGGLWRMDSALKLTNSIKYHQIVTCYFSQTHWKTPSKNGEWLVEWLEDCDSPDCIRGSLGRCDWFLAARSPTVELSSEGDEFPTLSRCIISGEPFWWKLKMNSTWRDNICVIHNV